MDWIIGICLGLLLISVIYHIVMIAYIVCDFLYEEIKFRIKQLSNKINKRKKNNNANQI